MWVQKCISQRQETVLALAKEILKHQESFFLYGPGHLSPLTMTALAEMTGVNESTVSRCAREKYIQCSWGLFSMSYFFVSGLANENGISISSDTIKEKLRRIIDTENKKKPLSDRIIADILVS